MNSEKSETPDVIHFLKENPWEMFKNKHPWSGCIDWISSVATTDSNAPSLFARRWTVGCCVIVMPVLHIKSPSISSIYLQFQAPFCSLCSLSEADIWTQNEKSSYNYSKQPVLVYQRGLGLSKNPSPSQTLSELGGDSITNDYNAIKFWKASVTHLRLQLFSEVKRAQTNSSLYHGGRELSNAPKYVR